MREGAAACRSVQGRGRNECWSGGRGSSPAVYPVGEAYAIAVGREGRRRRQRRHQTRCSGHEGCRPAPRRAALTDREEAVVCGLLARFGAASSYRLRAATDTIGAAGGFAPREPRNGLVEKSKIPPSEATMR